MAEGTIQFLETAKGRDTDLQILEVILYLADGDEDEADRIWRQPSNMELIDIFVILNERGMDPEGLRWAPLGLLWSRGLQEIM